MADVLDYATIYKEVNQVTRTVATRECSEVMAIQRMYVRLNDLDVKGLSNVGVVKQLVVLADVVEVEDGAVELPGSQAIAIVCRLLKITTPAGAIIRLSSLKPVVCISHLTNPAQPHPDVDPVPVIGIINEHVYPQGLSGPIVTILATEIVAPAGALLAVQCPVVVQCPNFLISNYPPTPFQSSGTVTWNSFAFGGASGATAATARSKFSVKTSSYPSLGVSGLVVLWVTKEEEWKPSFTVLLPETLPPHLLADSNILVGIEANTLACELITKFQQEAMQTVAAARDHTTWLKDQLLGEKDPTQQILNLQFRVQALLKLQTVDPNSAPLIVPRLQYESYDQLISLMTAAAESYDKDFKELNLFMQQNEILGSFLLEQNKAFAKKERDMEVHHSRVMDLQATELQLTKDKFNNLTDLLTQQNKEMEKAQADLEAGITAYKERQVALAFFATLVAIAQVCFAVVTGGATAGAAVGSAAQLSETAKTLQSVVKLVKRLEKIVKVIYAVLDFLSEMQSLELIMDSPEMPDLPTEAEWLIFENEIVAVAETMPEEISEVSAWKAKCKNVAALGREIITTADYMRKLQYELAVSRMLQEIASKQAEQLESLQIIDLDNYLKMATELDTRTSRMLIALLEVLSLQTGALSYHYLLPPRPLTGWVRMEAVWMALVNNAYDAVTALSLLGPSVNTTVHYPVTDIPVKLLMDGSDWVFDIQLDDPAFHPSIWSRVRIEYIELKFPLHEIADAAEAVVHLPTTTGGQIYILLQAGRFFNDRLKDQIFNYQAAVPLPYQYAYKLASGETTTTNRPSEESSGHYMRMTPFTRWSLRLSPSAPENGGLAFPTATTEDATTNITITFHLTVIRGISTRISADDDDNIDGR